MVQGGIIQIALTAFSNESVFIPSGAVTLFSSGSASDMVGIYAGNNTNANSLFPLMGQNYITIENFVGGMYTFAELGGRSPTVYIWCQGLEEYL